MKLLRIIGSILIIIGVATMLLSTPFVYGEHHYTLGNQPQHHSAPHASSGLTGYSREPTPTTKAQIDAANKAADSQEKTRRAMIDEQIQSLLKFKDEALKSGQLVENKSESYTLLGVGAFITILGYVLVFRIKKGAK